MLCFAVKVPTTNSTNDCFELDGTYHPCIEGIVYVFAETIGGAAKQLPIAECITLLGPALPFTSGARK